MRDHRNTPVHNVLTFLCYKMRLNYQRFVLYCLFLLLIFIVIDNIVMTRTMPTYDTDDVTFESHYLYGHIPGSQELKRTDDDITSLHRVMGGLNENRADQGNPQLVDIIRKYWLRPPPSRRPYNLDHPEYVDFSKGQSYHVDAALNRQRDGFFVECGGLDGETRSNTLFFERERGWSGLLIEAGPVNYRRLIKKNRRVWSSPACLGVHPYPTKMNFHRGRNRGRLIDDHAAIEWVNSQAMAVRLMQVQCFPLYSLLLALNTTRIDYFSLDVEGVELDVLKTIPWDVVDIHVMTVEFRHGSEGKEELRRYVESKGYDVIAEVIRSDGLANDFIFQKENWS